MNVEELTERFETYLTAQGLFNNWVIDQIDEIVKAFKTMTKNLAALYNIPYDDNSNNIPPS